MINDNVLNNLLHGKKTWKLRENEISADLETQMNIDRVKPCLGDISAFLDVPLHITKPRSVGSKVQYAAGRDSDYTYKVLVGFDSEICIRIDPTDDYYYDNRFFAECENINDLDTWIINEYGAPDQSGECLYNVKNVYEIKAAIKYYSRKAREQEEFEEAQQARKRRIAKRILVEKKKRSEKLRKALKEKAYRHYREELINSLSKEDEERIWAKVKSLRQLRDDAERYRDICKKKGWWSTYKKQVNKLADIKKQIDDTLEPIWARERAAKEKEEEERKKAKEAKLKAFEGKRIYSGSAPNSGFADPPDYYQCVEERNGQQLVRKIAEETVYDSGYLKYHGRDYITFPIPDEFRGEPIPLSELGGIEEFDPKNERTWIHWNYYTD